MYEYILAIQNLLVVICNSYKPCIKKIQHHQQNQKNKKKKCFSSYKAMIAFAK
jgi:hypothetical protein